MAPPKAWKELIRIPPSWWTGPQRLVDVRPRAMCGRDRGDRRSGGRTSNERHARTSDRGRDSEDCGQGGARYVAEVEPLIRRTATLELDGLLPVHDLTDRVERCL